MKKKYLSTQLSIQGRQDTRKQRRPCEHGEELLNESRNKSGIKPCDNLIRPNRAYIGHFHVHRGYRFKIAKLIVKNTEYIKLKIT